VSRQRSSKWLVEAAKRERAATKQGRRDQARSADEAKASDGGGPADHEGVLTALKALHERFEADEIGFEEFEEAKASLLARLAG
jgi:hypothetical protein